MEFVGKNVHWLLPEEPCPCDILLHFRGQFAVAVTGGQPVTFRILEKLSKTQCAQVFIRAKDQAAWDAWTAQRYPTIAPSKEAASPKDEATAQKQLYGNKRAELISFVQKGVQKRIEGDKQLDSAFVAGLGTVRSVVGLPSLDWYFKQFHEPPDLFQHNGRVAYLAAIFCHLHAVASPEEIEQLVYSALIHELEGSPATNVKTVVSQQTLDCLEKRKHPVPKEVLRLIEMHDELCSGKGFPNNRTINEIPSSVRVFTLFNHFDQYRLLSAGTRRARFDRTKQLMEARRADYDPGLWSKFWDFWESKVEAVS